MIKIYKEIQHKGNKYTAREMFQSNLKQCFREFKEKKNHFQWGGQGKALWRKYNLKDGFLRWAGKGEMFQVQEPGLRNYFTTTRIAVIKWTVTTDGENVKNSNFHTLLVGMQNGVATLYNSLVVFKNVKHRVTKRHSNSTPRY